MEIHVRGLEEDPIRVYCCTRHKRASEATQERVISVLADFGLNVTISYRGIQ